jgi:hypothetical protein
LSANGAGLNSSLGQPRKLSGLKARFTPFDKIKTIFDGLDRETFLARETESRLLRLAFATINQFLGDAPG